MRVNQQNIYVVIRGENIDCYSNLTKVVKYTPNLTYNPLYRALKKSNTTQRNGYIVCKTKLT